ncbi:hypothetical protein BGZ57DRAFT_935608 [Hyaloscypha finlandica]|nr:hypothetical protein BGZ57DRAFT_935608 [Hyaloscypha finlandica]
MSDIETVEYHQYYPPGVQRVVASGTSSWISVVDESTILNEHLHVIRLKSFSDIRLYLERAMNGTLYKYLAKSNHSTISI